MSIEKLESKIERLLKMSRLAPFAGILARQAAPSVKVLRKRMRVERMGLGASRFGGLPDMPSDWAWPRWDRYRNELDAWVVGSTPLCFIAQVDLEELPTTLGFPLCHGILYFFYDASAEPWGYDPRDRLGSRVLYYTGPRSALRRTEPPHDLAEVFHACKLTYRLELTLPETSVGVELEDDERDEYRNLRDRIAGVRSEPADALGYASSLAGCCHRFAGHPDCVQGNMLTECYLLGLGIAADVDENFDDPRIPPADQLQSEWSLLLQVDSDETGPGWMWADSGRLYYWLRANHLGAGVFDDTVCLLQSF